jgi:mono/diheme cytochrome c family protein
MRVPPVLGAGVMIAVALLPRATNAQSGRDSTPPASLYTAEQATRGEQVYRRICIECHETLEYTGSEFRAKWNGRPAFELFDLVRSTMPEETPGSLSAQEYADVLAYMMKLNAVAPGAAPMPTNSDALKKLKLDIPAPRR